MKPNSLWEWWQHIFLGIFFACFVLTGFVSIFNDTTWFGYVIHSTPKIDSEFSGLEKLFLGLLALDAIKKKITEALIRGDSNEKTTPITSPDSSAP